MKIRNSIAFAGTLALTAGLAQAAYTDITIFDGLIGKTFTSGQGGGPGVDTRLGLTGSNAEYNEVEVPSQVGKGWDLRAFGVEVKATNTGVKTTLAYQGGFNIAAEFDGATSGGPVTPASQISAAGGMFGIGTIFVSLDGAADYLPILAQSAANPYGILNNSFSKDPNNPNSTNRFSFDYAITLVTGSVAGTMDYAIYALTAASDLREAYFNVNQVSGPYLYRPTDPDNVNVGPIATGSSVPVSQTALAGLSTFGTSNYFAEFDISAISGLKIGSTFHLTQECGNDSMVGELTGGSLIIVPEPTNMIGLAGLLLGGAFLRSRRRA